MVPKLGSKMWKMALKKPHTREESENDVEAIREKILVKNNSQ